MKFKIAVMPRSMKFIYGLLGCLIFCLSHTQFILYHSNQNTKFLHGLANAGFGFLENDWLSNTWDPLFAFSTLVRFTYEYLSPFWFYIYYYVLLSLYFIFIIRIISKLFNIKKYSYTMLTFTAVFVFMHSALLHTISSEITGVSLTRLFTFGFAYQYIFNHYFQPSVFGIFIIISLYYFIDKKYFIAVVFSSAAMVLHSAYFLHAALLTIIYMIYAYAETKRLFISFFIGLLSLFIVMPVVINSLQHFESVSPEIQTQARKIVVDYIIPFHSIPKNWFSLAEVFKIAITIIGIMVVRRNKISSVLVVFFLIAILFTSVDFVFPNNTIRFMAPWRLSVIFYPLALLLLIGYMVKNIQWMHRHKQFCGIVSMVLLAGCLTFGVFHQYHLVKKHENRIYSQLMDHIKQNKKEGSIYFIPPYIDDFRLYTGVSIFINSKSHPYRSKEIIEWFNREQYAKRFYKDKKIDMDTIEKLASTYNITHLVLHKEQQIQEDKHHGISLQKEYSDEVYKIYKILQETPADLEAN